MNQCCPSTGARTLSTMVCKVMCVVVFKNSVEMVHESWCCQRFTKTSLQASYGTKRFAKAWHVSRTWHGMCSVLCVETTAVVAFFANHKNTKKWNCGPAALFVWTTKTLAHARCKPWSSWARPLITKNTVMLVWNFCEPQPWTLDPWPCHENNPSSDTAHNWWPWSHLAEMQMIKLTCSLN